MKSSIPLLLRSLAIPAILLAGTQASQAQASDNATLNVVLADVRSIRVNPAQNTVQLNFATATDYQNGVTSDQIAHLEVTSTGGYQIKVKASGSALLNGANAIPVNTITLTPGLNAGYTDPGATFTSLSLSATQQQLITTPNGSPRIMFDVRYGASGGQPYIGKPAGTYVTTITFSIEPA